jgi:hypothetical protein
VLHNLGENILVTPIKGYSEPIKTNGTRALRYWFSVIFIAEPDDSVMIEIEESDADGNWAVAPFATGSNGSWKLGLGEIGVTGISSGYVRMSWVTRVGSAILGSVSLSTRATGGRPGDRAEEAYDA